MSRHISLALAFVTGLAATQVALAGPRTSDRLRRQRQARERRADAREAYQQRLTSARQEGYDAAQAEGQAALARLRTEAQDVIRDLHRQLHYARTDIAKLKAEVETCERDSAERMAQAERIIDDLHGHLDRAQDQGYDPRDPVVEVPAQDFVVVPDLDGSSGPFGLPVNQKAPSTAPTLIEAPSTPPVTPEFQALLDEKFANLDAKEEKLETELASAQAELDRVNEQAEIHRQTILQNQVRLQADISRTTNKYRIRKLQEDFRNTNFEIAKRRSALRKQVPDLERRVADLRGSLEALRAERTRYQGYAPKPSAD
jgi:chromosome segregation ATPase